MRILYHSISPCSTSWRQRRVPSKRVRRAGLLRAHAIARATAGARSFVFRGLDRLRLARPASQDSLRFSTHELTQRKGPGSAACLSTPPLLSPADAQPSSSPQLVRPASQDALLYNLVDAASHAAGSCADKSQVSPGAWHLSNLPYTLTLYPLKRVKSVLAHGTCPTDTVQQALTVLPATPCPLPIPRPVVLHPTRGPLQN